VEIILWQVSNVFVAEVMDKSLVIWMIAKDAMEKDTIGQMSRNVLVVVVMDKNLETWMIAVSAIERTRLHKFFCLIMLK
jgi:hypothetical protein